MPLPNDIQNGHVPDADKVMENFEYLLTLIGGGGVAINEGLFSARPESPVVPQFFYATDQKQMWFYSVLDGEWSPR